MQDAESDAVSDAMIARARRRARARLPHGRVSDLSGGLTNRNLKVTTPDGVYVARLSSPESALLAIDRDNEHANSRAAAESGAAPDVIAFAPEVSVLVVRFIEGRPGHRPTSLEPRNAPRAAEALPHAALPGHGS